MPSSFIQEAAMAAVGTGATEVEMAVAVTAADTAADTVAGTEVGTVVDTVVDTVVVTGVEMTSTARITEADESTLSLSTRYTQTTVLVETMEISAGTKAMDAQVGGVGMAVRAAIGKTGDCVR